MEPARDGHDPADGLAPQTAPAATVLPEPAPRPGLGRIASLIARSAVLPGSGHLATGHRRTGWVLVTLALITLVAVAVGAAAALLSPATAASLAVRPDLLVAVRWAAIGVAAAWAAVIVWTAVLSRPGRRGAAGRLVAAGTAALLVAAVALPAALVSRYAEVQRSFVTDVFAGQPGAAGSGGSSTPPDRPISQGRLNVLLVGSDAGPDRTGVRTDTMVLASLDTRTGRTVLFTLPRNLERVPFEEGSVMAGQFPRGFRCADCLLNAVYAYGADHPELFPGDPEPGMSALRSAVTGVLGLSVDYYASVDLQGFSDLIDALGGVTLRVERRLPIGGLDARGNQVRPSGYIEPGLQRMNGGTALAYARSRSDSSDYERVQRQRCLIGAIQRQADPRTVLVNFQRIANSTADAVRTDIPQSLLPDLVKLAFKVTSQPLQGLAFTPPLVNVGRPDFPAIRTAVQDALRTPPPATPRPASPTPPAPSATGTPGPSASPTPSPAAPVSVEDVCAYS